jgi:hypothetical protein
MDLQQVTDIKALKALAYDLLAERENTDRNLQAVNARIAELAQEEEAKAQKNAKSKK